MGRLCIQVKANPVDWTSPLDSSFGGTPYLPNGILYPASQIDGKRYPMILLAQINFGAIGPFEPFPAMGILQIYCNPHNGSYGSDFKNPTLQEHFCVLYHETVSMDLTQLKSPPVFSVEDWNAMPMYRPHRLHFTMEYSAPWVGGNFV